MKAGESSPPPASAARTQLPGDGGSGDVPICVRPLTRQRPAGCDACATAETAAGDLLGKIVCKRAGLENLRIHDARHHCVSLAPVKGESLPMIGQLLGHTQVETTARYAHPAEDALRESAVRTSDSIAR